MARLLLLVGAGAIRGWGLSIDPADPFCTHDHTADMHKPLAQVRAENPDADLACYFKTAAKKADTNGQSIWVEPSAPVTKDSDYYYTSGKESSLNWPRIGPPYCQHPYVGDGKGPVKIYNAYGDRLTIPGDCGSDVFDDIYFYAVGWLKGQHLDGDKLKNSTAWEALIDEECRKLKVFHQFKDEEMTLASDMADNEYIGHHIADGSLPRRIQAKHVYTKCLMGKVYSEAAYSYSRACLKEGNVVGHRTQCWT